MDSPNKVCISGEISGQSLSIVRIAESLFKEIPVLLHLTSYVLQLSSPNLIGNDQNFVFFDMKYELCKTLSHVCFEKMPRN